MTATSTVTRTAVRDLALGFNGYKDGAGYDIANQFSADLGRGPEAWCGDTVTDIYKRAGLPLPPMQDGLRTGFAYVPAGLAYARAHNAITSSWLAQPGDLVCFDWNGDGTADHVEMADHIDGEWLFTVGGNSGGSNLVGDPYRGEGGVHRHVWDCPPGQGNALILGVIDTSKIVKFGAPSHQTKPGTAPSYPMLMLKTGHDGKPMQNQHVVEVQKVLHAARLWNRTPDGIYDTTTCGAVFNWQRAHHLVPDGIVGPATYKAMGVNV